MRVRYSRKFEKAVRLLFGQAYAKKIETELKRIDR